LIHVHRYHIDDHGSVADVVRLVLMFGLVVYVGSCGDGGNWSDVVVVQDVDAVADFETKKIEPVAAGTVKVTRI